MSLQMTVTEKTISSPGMLHIAAPPAKQSVNISIVLMGSRVPLMEKRNKPALASLFDLRSLSLLRLDEIHEGPQRRRHVMAAGVVEKWS
jgi:hypothetical protein